MSVKNEKLLNNRYVIPISKPVETIKKTYSLYCQEHKKDISRHENSEFNFTPRVVFKQFNSKVKLSFASRAMGKSKSFLSKAGEEPALDQLPRTEI